jgi:hypothetical protein
LSHGQLPRPHPNLNSDGPRFNPTYACLDKGKDGDGLLPVVTLAVAWADAC